MPDILKRIAPQLIALAALVALGRRHNGVNGDFLGSAIIAGEISALLPLALQA